ncbi:MAG: hypothetical protein GVY18_00460 [Bacteroidetes bacterium]|jgi:hypothetical protein|nr:hypothetical protein [Bacteroidota bacterium]
MLYQVQLNTLAHLDEEERKEALATLVEHTRTANGGATAYLRSRIKAFELRYEMTSDELLERLAEGTQKETAEIAEWLFLLDALEGGRE